MYGVNASVPKALVKHLVKWVAAVSYTHVDVYKRQYYPGGGGQWGGGHWGNAYTNRRAYGPSRSSYAGNRVSSSTCLLYTSVFVNIGNHIFKAIGFVG